MGERVSKENNKGFLYFYAVVLTLILIFEFISYIQTNVSLSPEETTAEGKTTIGGTVTASSQGETTLTVDVDTNSDGVPDYTIYIRKDEYPDFYNQKYVKGSTVKFTKLKLREGENSAYNPTSSTEKEISSGPKESKDSIENGDSIYDPLNPFNLQTPETITP